MVSGRQIMDGHRCKASCVWNIVMFILTPADGLCCDWFIYRLALVLCGGVVQNLHRSPARRRRRRKGNPVPGSITGPPCSWEIQIREHGPPGWGSLESETVKCGHESRMTRTKNDCAGKDQQQLWTTDSSSHQRGCYIRIITASVQFESKITSRESQGACRQDEPIGGKPPVIK
jgi:hypothetical protein